jgi:hypothetical protein
LGFHHKIVQFMCQQALAARAADAAHLSAAHPGLELALIQLLTP